MGKKLSDLVSILITMFQRKTQGSGGKKFGGHILNRFYLQNPVWRMELCNMKLLRISIWVDFCWSALVCISKGNEGKQGL